MSTLNRYNAPGDGLNYSTAVRVGDLIFTAGHLGAAAGDVPTSFEAQLRLTLQRLLDTVTAMGGSRETLIKVNGYIADVEYFPTYHEVYRDVFGDAALPARTTVQVGGFEPPILVELDAVAMRLERDR